MNRELYNNKIISHKFFRKLKNKITQKMKVLKIKDQ